MQVIDIILILDGVLALLLAYVIVMYVRPIGKPEPKQEKYITWPAHETYQHFQSRQKYKSNTELDRLLMPEAMEK